MQTPVDDEAPRQPPAWTWLLPALAGLEVAALVALLMDRADAALPLPPGPQGLISDGARMILSCLFAGAVAGALLARPLRRRSGPALSLVILGALLAGGAWFTCIEGRWGRIEISPDRLEVRTSRGYVVPFLEIPVSPTFVDYRASPVAPRLQELGLLSPPPREQATWIECYVWPPYQDGPGRLFLGRVDRADGAELLKSLDAEPERWREPWRKALEAARAGDGAAAERILHAALFR